MAFLSIKSQNPNFSYIIQKNPNTSEKCIAKEVRQGVAFGWFPNNNPQEFCIRFVDPPQEMSYNKAQYEYLDVTALSSPGAYNNLIRDFFSGLMKKGNPLDTNNYTNELILGFIKCDNKYLKHFSTFFPFISYEERAKDTYKIVFKGTTIQESLHIANIFCLFMMLSNEDLYIYMNEDVIDKYLLSIEKVTCPYYIANLFKTHLLKTEKAFSKYKSVLENACVHNVKLHRGNTLDARKEWVEKQLSIKNNIVDIGTGDKANYIYLSKDIKGLYYPIDKNPLVRNVITKKVERKKLDKVTEPFSDWYEVSKLLERDTEVLMTEVLEHNSLREAKELLKDVINHVYVKRVLITLPWGLFNPYYLLGESFRHEDHQWELTPEIETQIEELLNGIEGIKYEWSLIGDVITTDTSMKISPSKGLLINKV